MATRDIALPMGYKPRGDESSLSRGALQARLDRFKKNHPTKKTGGKKAAPKIPAGPRVADTGAGGYSPGIKTNIAPNAGQNKVFKPGLKMNKPGQVINTAFGVGEQGQVRGNVLTNPNQSFAGNDAIYDPQTNTYRRNESDLNRTVREGVQNIGIGANDALYRLITGGAFGSLTGAAGAGGAAPQSNYESAVFQRLTDGLDYQRNKDKEQLNQELANRGIPAGSEGWNSAMREVNDRYDRQFQNARATAVEQGTQTQMQAIPMLGATGQAGYIDPRFQQFTPVQYNQLDVNQLFNTVTQKKMADDQLALQRQQMAKMGAGGGGGESAPQESSPFNYSPPPGA